MELLTTLAKTQEKIIEINQTITDNIRIMSTHIIKSENHYKRKQRTHWKQKQYTNFANQVKHNKVYYNYSNGPKQTKNREWSHGNEREKELSE